MGKQREAFGRARFNQLLKKKGIDTNKMHSDNQKDAAAAKKRKDAAGKDLASFRKQTGVTSESVNEGILNKSTYNKKTAWLKAYAELKKMKKDVPANKMRDYKNLLNQFFHTLDDFNPSNMDKWNTKTSKKNNLGDDPVADLRFELKDILGKDANKIMESVDEAMTMVSRKPHPTGGHIVTLKDKNGKKVVRHLHKGKVKTLSKEETELDEKRNIKIAKSGKGERMVNKQELRTYLQMGWKEVKEGNGLWANIAAKKARGEKMRKKGAKGAPTDAQIKHAQSTSESVEKKEIEEISVGMQKRYMTKARSQYKSSTKKKSVGGDFGGSKTQAAADRHKKTYDKRHKGIGSVIKRASDHDQKRKGGAFVSQNPSKNSMTGKKAPYKNPTESVEHITELTAKEKQLVNQMYDKKGNLTPLGKKVFNHNKKPGDKGYVE